jgi:formyl-CoA transferase
VFPASDGHINIAASSARLWGRFCEAIGKPEWLTREGWQTQKGRSNDRAAINAAIGDVTKHKPSEHWIELFEGAGIPCGPINTIDKVFADPQVQHLGMAAPMHHPRLGDKALVASAISISGFSKAVRSWCCAKSATATPRSRRCTNREWSDGRGDHRQGRQQGIRRR